MITINKDQYTYIGITTICGEDIHIAKDDDYFYAGILANSRLAATDKYKIDTDRSSDQNLVDFIEFLEDDYDC